MCSESVEECSSPPDTCRQQAGGGVTNKSNQQFLDNQTDLEQQQLAHLLDSLVHLELGHG